MTLVKVFTPTHLRRGGSSKGPDNLVIPELLPAGEYEALVQCAGQDVTDPAIGHNYWWVQIATPWGTGWVTAVHIATGGDDEPIPGVDTGSTRFSSLDYPPSAIAHRPLVHVYRATALRAGGSTRSDPDNLVQPELLPARQYHALEQCAGEEVVVGSDRNFWWVLVAAPSGLGWITAVDIATGGNDEPIPDPGIVRNPTVFIGV